MTGRHEAILRLRSSWWVKDKNVQQIFSVLDGEAGCTRAVGGIVRDTILDTQGLGTDVDLATTLLPDDVLKRTRGAGMSCYPTGIEHGTVTVRNGQVIAEVTTLRQDITTDGRHAHVGFGTDWEADARRRDFTMNALYVDYEGALFDPLEGLEDVFEQRVRFIGDPDQRIGEDRLRVFRFFRFCASHGREACDGPGLAACKRAASDLGNISAERIGDEMLKILALQRVAATLTRMKLAGVMEFSVPALSALARYEDFTGVPVVAGRLAVLFNGDGSEKLRASWRLSSSLVNEAIGVLSAANMMIAGDLFQAAYRHGRFAYVALPVAAALGNWSQDQMLEVKAFWDQMNVPGFPVNGDDLLAAGFSQGPELGNALRRIEADWIKSGFELNREQLLQNLASYLKKDGS